MTASVDELLGGLPDAVGAREYLHAQREALADIAAAAGMSDDEREAYLQAAEDGFLLGLAGTDLTAEAERDG